MAIMLGIYMLGIYMPGGIDPFIYAIPCIAYYIIICCIIIYCCMMNAYIYSLFI